MCSCPDVTNNLSMSGCRIFIGRLSPSAREKDVERFFKGYGRIRDIDLKRGFGFVVSHNSTYEHSNEIKIPLHNSILSVSVKIDVEVLVTLDLNLILWHTQWLNKPVGCSWAIVELRVEVISAC